MNEGATDAEWCFTVKVKTFKIFALLRRWLIRFLPITVEIPCRSLCEGHLVLSRCDWNHKKIEFLAMISTISYVRKSGNLMISRLTNTFARLTFDFVSTEYMRLAHFTLETSVLNEMFPMQLLQIRPITVISNTLNAFRSVYNLDNSPLLDMILNPLSGPPRRKLEARVAYKGYVSANEKMCGRISLWLCLYRS